METKKERHCSRRRLGLTLGDLMDFDLVIEKDFVTDSVMETEKT